MVRTPPRARYWRIDLDEHICSRINQSLATIARHFGNVGLRQLHINVLQSVAIDRLILLHTCSSRSIRQLSQCRIFWFSQVQDFKHRTTSCPIKYGGRKWAGERLQLFGVCCVVYWKGQVPSQKTVWTRGPLYNQPINQLINQFCISHACMRPSKQCSINLPLHFYT